MVKKRAFEMQESQTDRRRFLMQSLAWGAASSLPLTSFAQPFAPTDTELTAQELITPETEQAVEKGLEFLASRQTEEGCFGTSGYQRNVAVCALAGMAFMAGGSTPGRGKYGRQIRMIVDYLLAHSNDDGFIISRGSESHGPMYGHGFATLMLAEVYGMSPRSDVRDALTKAVQLIIDSQNNEGGWRYQPQRSEADLSVTIAQVMALRAARNAGISVPNETIEATIEYVKQSQNPDGGFMYIMSAGGPSAFPRSAAGVVALYSAGIYEGDEIDKGLAYIMEHRPVADAPDRDMYFFYGHYYASQAMWHAGGDHWREWYPAVRDAIVSRQRSNGSWQDAICYEYGTAMACIVLQMPNNYLPIFQR